MLWIREESGGTICREIDVSMCNRVVEGFWRDRVDVVHKKVKATCVKTIDKLSEKEKI